MLILSRHQPADHRESGQLCVASMSITVWKGLEQPGVEELQDISDQLHDSEVVSYSSAL